MSNDLSSQQNAADPFAPVDPSIVEREKTALFHMLSELNLVQLRLGKPEEKAGDCERACDLGHAIRNKLQALSMWGALGMMKAAKADQTEQLQAI
jgi:hypothetical protein